MLARNVAVGVIAVVVLVQASLAPISIVTYLHPVPTAFAAWRVQAARQRTR